MEGRFRVVGNMGHSKVGIVDSYVAMVVVGIVRFESTKHKGGELCYIKYCQIFTNSQLACLD